MANGRHGGGVGAGGLEIIHHLKIPVLQKVLTNYKFLLNQLCMTSLFTKWERSLIFLHLKSPVFSSRR